ncbi:hypothetical protein SAMN05421812_102690 [Asanoa hainanensis]|uniref:SMI1-KNR4 cell-wall n=1 Tax=Asanoa hainanensis TaxID=560556 RepID=A0A239J2E6_9ACTN|nr:hypothetical protein [Asanoa hainanensis]SNT00017.1 hypothetical protein SAMN05421812_102690 [Asanoa hainanensis]
MISSEVGAVVETIRSSLPLEREWRMMNSMPGPARPPAPPDVPAAYLDFLAVADGFICGPVVLFDSATVPTMQFYADHQEDAPVRLTPETWFCAGTVNDEPWFIDRTDETVWGFPDTGVTWWMSDRFDQLAPSLERFFLGVVCGPAYLTLTAAEEGDQWCELLRRLGRLPGIADL